eukprot:Em0022g570a
MDRPNNEHKRKRVESETSCQTVCTKLQQTEEHPKAECPNDEELERLAVEAILQETKRAKLRAENAGAFGWKKKTLTTNKRFINAVVCGTVSSNRRQMAKDEYKTDTRERKDRERKWRDEDIKREKEGRKREDKREKVKDKRSHRHGQSPS